MTKKGLALLNLLSVMALIAICAIVHPSLAHATAALATLPQPVNDGLAQLIANLSTPIALGSAAAVPLYSIIEHAIMSWLPSASTVTNADGTTTTTGNGWTALRASMPAILSTIGGVTTGLLGGASWLQIGLGILTTWGGSVLMHDVIKPGQKGPMDPVLAAAMAQKQGHA